MDNTYKPEIPTKALRFFNKVKDLIEYCCYDQPYDGGEVIWLLGEQTDLTEIFNEYKIPENYRDVIAANMVCQNCGNSEFDLCTTVCTKDRFEIAIDKKLEVADIKFKRQIEELLNHITKYPSLVLNNALAKKVFNEIMSKTLPSYKLDKGTYYRSRRVRDSTVFNSEQLGAPEIGIANLGRFNHAGQSVLYLSENKKCSMLEILNETKEPKLIWVQKYKVEKIDNILNLSIERDELLELNSILFTAILNNDVLKKQSNLKDSNWKPEYFLTNFVADSAKLAGYNGIRYSSAKNWGNSNIVLFNPKHECVKPFRKPRVLVFDPLKNGFFNDDVSPWESKSSI